MGETVSARILDDQDAMREVDKSNMLGFCVDAAENFLVSAKNAEKVKVNYAVPKNVVLAGMGGSAIGGELLKDYTRASVHVPIAVSREYQLPAYANKNSLVILASYSGDTEETLSSFLDAYKRGCKIYCISSGGALLQYAEKLGVPYLQVKTGMPPRAAMPHMLMPLLKVMQTLRLTPPSLDDEFTETITLLRQISKDNAPQKISGQNFSKTLAAQLNGITPVVYGFGFYRSVALRWKQQFNENSKVPAKWEYFSELNHNETMGWESAKTLANGYGVVMFRDHEEPIQMRSRLEITKALMEPSLQKIFEVWAQGKSTLARMLSTILVGDFTSIYLALLRNVDPTPVKTVTVMKEQIEQNGVKRKILAELENLVTKQ